MALFIDLQSDTVGDVERGSIVDGDLSTITRCDQGYMLGDQSGALTPIIYDQPSTGFGQNLIKSLVTFSQMIIITGVDSTFTLSNGTVITSAAGAAVQETPSLIRVWYDTTQAAGKNYFVVDKRGNKISFPNPIILAHELSHAFHFAIGDVSSLPEVQAEIDENSFRDQVAFPERNSQSHFGGVGLPGASLDVPCP